MAKKKQRLTKTRSERMGLFLSDYLLRRPDEWWFPAERLAYGWYESETGVEYEKWRRFPAEYRRDVAAELISWVLTVPVIWAGGSLKLYTWQMGSEGVIGFCRVKGDRLGSED